MGKSTITRRSFVGLTGSFVGASLTGLSGMPLFESNAVNLDKNKVITVENKSVWWRDRPPRIYHPNMRSFEAVNLDVKQFIRDCTATQCEAIVMSAGGIWAFYQTKVNYHTISPTIGKRDLLANVVEEAKNQGLKVIARLDFRKARPELYDLHPDWFQLDDNEQVCKEGDYYSATPLGGYQNEAFAIPVMQELMNEYGVDGIHLNAAGFRGIYRDKRTMQAYQGNESDFMEWREHIVANQILSYRKAIQSINPEALLMGELAGISSGGWAEDRGWNPKLLAKGFTNLLTTSGRMDSVHVSRWWPGLTAKSIKAAKADGTPLINLKIEHRNYGFQDFLIAPAVYKLNCYQSIANGAGLKTPTYGLIGNKYDPRTSAVLAEVFGFMKANEELLSSTEELTPVALVVPKKMDGNTNDEFVGLARMLIQRHILFSMIHEEDLKESIPNGITALVIPTGEIDATVVEQLGGFTQQGGIILVCSSIVDGNMSRLLDIQMDEGFLEANYVLAEKLDWDLGPLGIVGPPGLIKNWDGADVLMVASDGLVKGDVVEDFPPLNRSTQPVAISKQQGKGRITYFAAGLGFSFQNYPHPDYAFLLDKLLALDDLEKNVLLDGSDAVQMNVFQKEEKLLVHLVNGSGNPLLENTPVLGAMTIRLPGRQVKEALLYAPTAELIKMIINSDEHGSSVIVPKLETYGLLELKV